MYVDNNDSPWWDESPQHSNDIEYGTYDRNVSKVLNFNTLIYFIERAKKKHTFNTFFTSIEPIDDIYHSNVLFIIPSISSRVAWKFSMIYLEPFFFEWNGMGTRVLISIWNWWRWHFYLKHWTKLEPYNLLELLK